MAHETKSIEDQVELSILFADNLWTLMEDEDAQTYDSYDAAKADFDKVTDLAMLTKVFGWKNNPFELKE